MHSAMVVIKCVYVHVRLHDCVCVCMCVCVCASVCAFVHMHACACLVCVHTCMRACMQYVHVVLCVVSVLHIYSVVYLSRSACPYVLYNMTCITLPLPPSEISSQLCGQ